MFQPTKIDGCLVGHLPSHVDGRGSFVKVFSKNITAALPIDFNIKEVFLTNSWKGVIRGMHFQIPPYDHNKLIVCLAGEVDDYILDLRRKSKTYGQTLKTTLSETSNCVFIPRGCAHGFATLSEQAQLCYFIDSDYSPEHDKGILWNSIGIDWAIEAPIVSTRDQDFPALGEYNSPFID